MATSIGHIENGEQGLSVRNKLNNLIDLALRNEQSIAGDSRVLSEAVDNIAMLISNGAKFKGIAREDSSLDTDKDSVFYITSLRSDAITYEHLGGITVPAGVIGLISFNVDTKAGTSGFVYEPLVRIEESIREGSIYPVMARGIAEAINSCNVSGVEIKISSHTKNELTLQNKITHSDGRDKGGSVTLPSATQSKSGLQSGDDKKKLDSIEENATLGFQSIHDVQTNQTLRAYRDRPLELVIDKTLIRVTFNDELHQMMIDPVGLAKISEAIGGGSTSVVQNEDNIKINAKLQSVDGQREEDISFTIPLASATKAGLLSPSEKGQIATLSTKVGELETKSDNYEDRLKTLEFETNRDFFVAGYVKDSTDAKPTKEYGNKAILKEFYPYLVTTRTTDSNDNPIDAISKDGERLRPVGQLMSNNFLRFTDGDFAPVVGITQAQYDECMTNKLYLDEQGEEVYCDVGGYDAEKYFEEIREDLQANPMVEHPKKLYKKVGEEYVEVSHYLKPYETVDAHYSIVMGTPHKLYVLDDVEGDSGLIWKGIFLNNTIWDGIDVSQYVLEPTGVNPCPVTMVTEDGIQKVKCYFYNYKAGGSQNAGAGATNMFVKNRTYPKTEDMSQLSNVTRARNNNPDRTKPYPFAEGGFFARTTFLNAIELRMGTRDLTTLFGSGISSNDGCTSEATFYKYGGFRYSADGGNSWSYRTWGTNVPIYYGNAGSRKTSNASEFVNNYRPKEECMESQMAVSYACELGIQSAEIDGHNNNFTFYGETYWYRDVNNDNAIGLLAGGMDCQVYKTMAIDYEGYADNTTTEKTSYKLECCLRMSLHGGMNLSGDVFDYCGGGIEMIGYVTDSNKASGSYGVDVKVYVEHDQRKWVNDTNIIIDDSKDFDAETHYTFIGETKTTGDGYIRRRLANAPIKVINASTIHQGVCGYVWNTNYFCNTANKKARLGVRFRGHASHSYCSARSLYANYSVSHPTSTYGGSAQVLLDFGAE